MFVPQVVWSPKLLLLLSFLVLQLLGPRNIFGPPSMLLDFKDRAFPLLSDSKNDLYMALISLNADDNKHYKEPTPHLLNKLSLSCQSQSP